LTDTYCGDDSDLTLVVITFNRYACLSRLLRFYEKFDVRFRFLILDSSSCEPPNIIEVLGSKLDIEYLKFQSSIFFSRKISEGCINTRTKFSVLSADDDFLLPSGLRESMYFLASNRDYSSAHGRYFKYNVLRSSHCKLTINFSPKYLNGDSTVSDCPIDRVKSYLSGKSRYYPLYAVHRTNEFQKIWRSTSTYVSDWGLSELYPCTLSLIFGKSKVLDIDYCCRAPNSFRWYDDLRHLQMYSEEKLLRATDGIVEAFNSGGSTNINRARDMIETQLDEFKLYHVIRSMKNIPHKLVVKYLITRLKFLLRLFVQIWNLGYRKFLGAVFPPLLGKIGSASLVKSAMEWEEIKLLVLRTSDNDEIENSRAIYTNNK
jgi:glycosyltransferase domain-containing protein